MVAKDKVERPDVAQGPDLREDIDDFADGVSDDFEVIAAYRREMQKDRHLLTAALAADEIILSLNETDRRRFAEACDDLPPIRTIVWTNPEREADNCLDWLEQGASPEPHLRLRNYPTD
jgi:hypothetical protein